MSKIGIIKGIDGNFMPKAITSAQIAEGYANTTREQAIAMGVRAFENIKLASNIKAGKIASLCFKKNLYEEG